MLFYAAPFKKERIVMRIKILRSCLKNLFFTMMLSILVYGSAHAFTLGDIDKDGSVQVTEAVYALQVTSGARTIMSTAIINVPGDFDTIQEAIDAASEGDTITVAAGTYNENIFIRKDHITIEGADKATTIISAGNTAAETIKIYNCTNVTINNVQIKGGIIGIKAFAANFYITNSIIQNNDVGIKTQFNASAIIEDSFVKNNTVDGLKCIFGSSFYAGGTEFTGNADNGLDLYSNASGIISSCTISTNGGTGISVSGGSHIVIENNSEISSNAGSGVGVYRSSQANIINTMVSSNTLSGIEVVHNAGAKIETSEITNNGAGDVWAGGIGIYHAGYVNVSNSEIYLNQGPGVDMTGGSVMKMQGGDTRVHSNAMYGVGIHNSSNARFYDTVSITNNTGFGIECGSASEVTKSEIYFGDDTNLDPTYHTNVEGAEACGLGL